MKLKEGFKELDQSHFLEFLKKYEWVEGQHIPVLLASYRHVVVVACLKSGRNKARFANGEFPYYAYMALTNRRLDFTKSGCMLVPVLPGSRILMIIEQRPFMASYAESNRKLILDNGEIPLGPADSVEFPGGAVESEEDPTAGGLRELYEECGIPRQPATLILADHPYHTWQELALKTFYGVIFLTKDRFSTKTLDEGGEIKVLALNHEEVIRNVRNGVINTALALIGWNFYKQVTSRNGQRDTLFKISEVKIK